MLIALFVVMINILFINGYKVKYSKISSDEFNKLSLEIPYESDNLYIISSQTQFNAVFDTLNKTTVHYESEYKNMSSSDPYYSIYLEECKDLEEFLSIIGKTKNKLINSFNIDSKFFDKYIIVFCLSNSTHHSSINSISYKPLSKELTFKDKVRSRFL